MQRKNFSVIVVGQKGTGKSTLVKNLMTKRSKLPKKLIYDPSLQNLWQEFPVVATEHLGAWRHGTKKIIETDSNKVIQAINAQVRNTFIIFDDASAYIDEIVGRDLKTLMTRNRHRNNDIFFIFHSLRIVPVKVYTYASHLILFKTNDTEKNLRRLDKIPGFDKVLQAWQYVNTKYSENEHINAVVEL